MTEANDKLISTGACMCSANKKNNNKIYINKTKAKRYRYILELKNKESKDSKEMQRKSFPGTTHFTKKQWRRNKIITKGASYSILTSTFL